MLASVASHKPVLHFCLLTLFSSAALAASDTQGGTIHFVGQIIEAPCDITQARQRFSMTCDREGQRQTRSYSEQGLINVPQHFRQIASVNVRYLDKEKKMAVMNIDYR